MAVNYLILHIWGSSCLYEQQHCEEWGVRRFRCRLNIISRAAEEVLCPASAIDDITALSFLYGSS
jgi:hypothetical protein